MQQWVTNMLPLSEVKAQDYIYFDEDTIRPAICRLEQVDNWVGKKIVLDIEDKCTVTIDEHIEGGTVLLLNIFATSVSSYRLILDSVKTLA